MEQQTTNKMAVEPVGKLMLSMGIPMILSMMLQAVYNIVDSAFVGGIPENGELALNALTLAFPVQMLMVAISIGTGVGANALLSKSLGQGDMDKAKKVAGNAITIGAIIYFIFLLFGILGVKPYIFSQTENPVVRQMAQQYLMICCIISVGIVFFSVFEKLLQATGNSLYSTIAQIAGAVVNIILDPILIYGYLGLPVMGVRGAAYATVIGQIVSFVLGVVFHWHRNSQIRSRRTDFRLEGQIVHDIYAIGLPAIIAQALMSFMTYGLNLILGRIGEAVVTAYGLYYKVQQFVLFAAFGLRDAITPIVSFNHGRQDRKRVQEGIKYGMTYTLIIMFIGMVALECLANPLAALFGLSGETKTICIGAIRVISLSFLFAGANVAFQGIFQALSCGLESLVISVCRQFLFVLPVAWGFSLLASKDISYLNLVWSTFLIAEGLSCVIACLFMKRARQSF